MKIPAFQRNPLVTRSTPGAVKVLFGSQRQHVSSNPAPWLLLGNLCPVPDDLVLLSVRSAIGAERSCGGGDVAPTVKRGQLKAFRHRGT